MVQVISGGERKARKPHQCFECYRTIAPGMTHVFQTNIYNGSIYTLRWHVDCGECALAYRRLLDHYYDDQGFPPLRDEWRDSGEYENYCNNLRGFYPHVVARMELTDQLRWATP